MTRRHAIFLAVLLSACGGGSSTTTGPPPVPNDGAFAVQLDPPALDAHLLDTGSIRVLVTRRADISGPVTISFVEGATGLETTPLTIAGDEGVLTFHVTEAAALGTRFPILEAKLGSSTHRETLTLRLGGIVGEAVAVAVRDHPGGQIRQGLGDVVVDVDGTNLDRVTAFRLGDLGVTELPGRTSTRLSFTASVPHGTLPGPKDLVLTAPGGDTVTAGALVVTAVTAGPAGNDATGLGTTAAPLRTLTQALTLAQAGDTVLLLDGTYDAAHGEVWPAVGSSAVSPIARGVRVQGQTRAGAVLQGPGPGALFAGLLFGDDGSAVQLTIRGFLAGVLVNAGAVTLQGLTITSTTGGLLLGGGTVSGGDCDISGSGLGVLAVGTTVFSLSAGAIHDNTGDGITAGDGTPQVTVSGTEITANETGLVAAGSAAVVLQGSAHVHDNRTHGVQGIDDAQLTVTSSELAANGQAGLWFEGRTLVVRGTTVRDNLQFGLYVARSPVKVDLGNFLDPGNDDVHGNGPNGMGDQLLDVRDPRATLGDPETFTLKGTQLNGVVPAADVYPGDGTWPYLNSPYFSVLGTNNVIRAY